jgi:hypothetical protein
MVEHINHRSLLLEPFYSVGARKPLASRWTKARQRRHLVIDLADGQR